MATPIGSPRVPSTVGSSLVTRAARDDVEPDDSAHAAPCASHASLARSANASLLASPAEDDQSAPMHVPLLPCTAFATPGTMNASLPAADTRPCFAPFFPPDRFLVLSSVPSRGIQRAPGPSLGPDRTTVARTGKGNSCGPTPAMTGVRSFCRPR